MDYEKEYKEALEQAREMLKSKRSVLVEKQALVKIFPELAESKDERTRKEIVEFIQWATDRGSVPDEQFQAKRPGEWLAYLEKMKDSKWSPSEDEMGVLYKLCYISKQVTDEDDTILTRLYQDLKREYFNGHSFENMFPYEKQIEQKSAEKQDYSGLNDLERAILRGFLAAGVENVPVGIIKETEQDFLAHLPAGWTDADEKILKRIIGRLGFVIPVPGEGLVGVTFKHGEDTEAINWLKRRVAPPQPQPKQEWSEEDEKNWGQIFACIKDDALKEWLEKRRAQIEQDCLACDQHLKGYIAGRKVMEEEHQCDCEHVGCHINNCRRWCNKFQAEIPYYECHNRCGGYSQKRPGATQGLTLPEWKFAPAGTKFNEDMLVVGTGEDKDPRLSRCAVNDCYYIPVSKLMPGWSKD